MLFDYGPAAPDFAKEALYRSGLGIGTSAGGAVNAVLGLGTSVMSEAIGGLSKTDTVAARLFPHAKAAAAAAASNATNAERAAIAAVAKARALEAKAASLDALETAAKAAQDAQKVAEQAVANPKNLAPDALNKARQAAEDATKAAKLAVASLTFEGGPAAVNAAKSAATLAKISATAAETAVESAVKASAKAAAKAAGSAASKIIGGPVSIIVGTAMEIAGAGIETIVSQNQGGKLQDAVNTARTWTPDLKTMMASEDTRSQLLALLTASF
jgi:hypothetical protein